MGFSITFYKIFLTGQSSESVANLKIKGEVGIAVFRIAPDSTFRFSVNITVGAVIGSLVIGKIYGVLQILACKIIRENC